MDPVRARPVPWPRIALLAVAVVAVVARLAYYSEVSAKPWFGVALLDARTILEQAGYLRDHFRFPPGAHFRPPLYTLFVWLFVEMGEPVTATVILVQHLLGVATCLAVFAIGRRCGGLAAGTAAGLLAALYAPGVFYEGEPLGDSLALFLNTVFLWAWLRAAERGTTKWFAAAGLAAGLAAITRPTILPVAAVFVLAELVRIFRANPGVRASLVRAATGPALFCGVILLLVGIPTCQNAAAGDPNLVCSQGGINFWIGNHGNANGVNVVIPRLAQENPFYPDSVQGASVLGWLEAQNGVEMGRALFASADPQQHPKASDVSRFWYRRAWDWMRANPADAARLWARKTVALINDFEVRNNREFGFARRHESLVLRLLPVTFGWLACFAAAGAAGWTMRRGFPLASSANAPAVAWVFLYTVITGFGIVAFFVAGRLRLPLVTGMLVLAGMGAASLVEAALRRRWAAFAAMGTAFVLAGILSFSFWPGLDFRTRPGDPPGGGILTTSQPAQENFLLAVASLENQKPEAALRYARAAQKADPEFDSAALVEGNACMALNDTPGAARAFVRSIRSEPLAPAPQVNLGVVFEKRGMWQEAAEMYGHVLETYPTHPRALTNLAVLQYRSGRKAEAGDTARRTAGADGRNAIAFALLHAAESITTSARETPAPSLSAAQQARVARILEQVEAEKPLPRPVDLGSRRPLAELLNAALTAR